MTLGKFITLEGGEATGKSTQAKLIVEHLSKCGINVVLTREPGGSPSAESIRSLLVTGTPDRWDSLSEYLLFSAARRDHIIKTILPALQEGTWVICDRFYDSSRVYQGYCRGLDLKFMDSVYNKISEGLVPDLTLLFDLPPEAGKGRLEIRMSEEDRFEQMGSSFHQRVRESYLQLAASEKERFCIINARQTMADVFTAIVNILQDKFSIRSLVSDAST